MAEGSDGESARDDSVEGQAVAVATQPSPVLSPKERSWTSFARETLLVLALSAIIGCAYWWPILYGYGFVGGDVYNYFFPLKQYYHSSLVRGEIPLWHPLIGHGVPLVGESQTGVFYPPNLIAYRFLDPHLAYHLLYIVHYAWGFVGYYVFARRARLNIIGALLASVTITYGWFPARSCLEWAMVTGAWTGWILAGTLAWLSDRRAKWLWWITLCVSLQLLAGHFQMQFITALGVVIISLIYPTGKLESGNPASRSFTWWTMRGWVIAALVIGFLGAAGQLLPSWELKSISQRAEKDFAGTVIYGRSPVWYWQSWWRPFDVFPQAEEFINAHHEGHITNFVEAHLYFGSVTWIFLFLGLIAAVAQRRPVVRSEQGGDKYPQAVRLPILPWLILFAIGMALAEGSVFHYLSQLPGFGYFRYPGRYSLLAQIGFAMLAGTGVTWFLQVVRPSKAWSLLVTTITLFATTYLLIEFYQLAGPMLPGRGRYKAQYVTLVNPPMWRFREQSAVFRKLRPTDRVLAIDGNTLALSGASCVPPYLGLGPAGYYKLWGQLPNVFHGKLKPEDRTIVLQILADAGVTHLLTEEPLPDDYPVELLFADVDQFLHRRWSRDPSQPLYLYRVKSGTSRLRFTSAGSSTADGNREQPQPVNQFRYAITNYQSGKVTVEIDVTTAGTVTLLDLDFPGWSARVEEVSEISERSNVKQGLIDQVDPSTANIAEQSGIKFRSVAVGARKHRITWEYHPKSVYWGWMIAVITLPLFVLISARWTKKVEVA